ncbi:MAG: helicase-exonuclease AddAB subunit AddA [Phycisphaerales bacterium]|jgi:ATP-dependent helicase/nuclease subunit A
MAEKKIKWTDQQQQVIKALGSDVLVTASAGTGKTATLSGRCVNIVSDKSLCPDVRNILVLTFTEAAAEQMRARIAQQLKEAFEQKPDNRLRYQLIMLQGADISTIHSFCKRLITEYFYKLGLDPTFRVIDGDEQKLLKAEVLEKTIDLAWQKNNLQKDFEQLLYRRDLRTGDGFLAEVIHISDFLDGVISRQNWYERATQLADQVNTFATALGEKQRQIVKDKLQRILSQISYAIRLYESENVGGSWATKWKETFVEPVTEYVELIGSGNWGKFSEQIKNYQKPSRFGYKPRGLSGPVAEIIKSTAENAKKSFDKLCNLAVLDTDYIDNLSDSVGLQTGVLIELVKEFDGLYSQAKRTLNCLDFADLEHKALELLTKEDSLEGEPEPSDTALMLRERYKYIFVDEYQDINSVQQRILRMLSPGGNILQVGDVKQSIYAFRGAQPDIFLNQLKQASSDPEKTLTGLRVDLNVNFRSTAGILDFVNRIFSRIMTFSFTKIDYDESARLRPALKDESDDQSSDANEPVVEFHLLDEADTDDNSQDGKNEMAAEEENTDIVTSRQRQAAMIAERIKQMVGAGTGKPEFQIYDKQRDTVRDVQYGDIVVLMRSLAKKANDYVEVFGLAGIPVSCQATAGYFQATEISDMTALLKVLDNPQRDIELAAVLRSPFFKINDTELAKIKISGKENPKCRNYYGCVLQYCNAGTDEKLIIKLKRVVERIKWWRTIARRGHLADLIWWVYRETGYLSFVSALPNGRARKANLLKLHDRAIQFEEFVSSAGIPSLKRFVEFIEKLQETGQDWAPAEPQTSAGNAVRILSVHKSKGLEFPVVFLAELESQFNKSDIHADILTDTDYTLGLQVIDHKSNSKLNSLAHEVIAEQKLSTILAEEMRILYVATTRARERLILTASQKQTNCRRIISNGFFFGAEPVPDWELRSCHCPLEWILYGLSEQKNLHVAFETGLAEKAPDDNLFNLRVYSRSDLQKLSDFVVGLRSNKLTRTPSASKKKRSKKADSKLLPQIKKSLGWRYPLGDVYILPAKRSVTQLTHFNDEYVKFDYSRALNRQPKVLAEAEPALAKPVEPRLIGTATHLLISRLDLAEPVAERAVDKIKEKLIADNLLTARVAECIDTESILSFFEHELGQMVLDKDNSVLREWPFTFALPASEFPDSIHEPRATSGEVIVVQGIIDMLVRTPEGLVVIDFKTDNVMANQVNERAGFYRGQLELYGRAASAILKLNTIAEWLYFLTPRVPFKV